MIKELIRNTLQFLHLDLTKNLEYDRLTKKILNEVLDADSNTIDVGCHKGEILQIILKKSPNGEHYAFEPIPAYFEALKRNFSGRAKIYPYALSDQNGITVFQHVKNAPAFSGIKKRKYLIENPDIEEIEVQMKILDDVVDPEKKIDLIKIDVEGGELAVLKGGRILIKKQKPIIIFECGLGASEYYGTSSSEIHQFICNESGMKISTLLSYVKKGKPLTEMEFEKSFNSNSDYYFVAHP